LLSGKPLSRRLVPIMDRYAYQANSVSFYQPFVISVDRSFSGKNTCIPILPLSRPLHNVDGQSRSWGVCIILASRREELHLYRLQVIKDLAVSTPHPWLRGHFEGTDRSDSLNVGRTQRNRPDTVGHPQSAVHSAAISPTATLAEHGLLSQRFTGA
jgi:hypothetical protein